MKTGKNEVREGTREEFSIFSGCADRRAASRRDQGRDQG